MATKKARKPAAVKLDPALTLEQLVPGTGYWKVLLHGERIGDVSASTCGAGATGGPPGLHGQQHGHRTRNEAANEVLRRYLTEHGRSAAPPAEHAVVPASADGALW